MSFEALTADLRALATIPGVRIVSLGDLQRGGDDLSADRLRVNTSLWSSFVLQHQLLPWSLGLYPTKGVYYTQDAARSVLARQFLACTLLYASLICAAGFTTSLVIRWSGQAAKHVIATLTVLSFSTAVALVLKFLFGSFQISSALALACCIGIFVSGTRHQLTKRQAKLIFSLGAERSETEAGTLPHTGQVDGSTS